MKKPRRSEGNNLAFLDVMACGLGAAVLLFLIVKHNTGSAVEAEAKANDQTEQSVILAALLEDQEVLGQQVEVERRKSAADEQLRQENEQQLASKESKLDALQNLLSQIEQQRTRKSTLQDKLLNTQPKQSTVIIDNPQLGEEDYLIGLKVEGRRIAILIDHSASMTDDLLIDILVRKNQSKDYKSKGPKWQRTKRVAQWLLARLPKEGQVAVVAFNNRAKLLNKGTWTGNRDRQGIQEILQKIEKLVPTGATNLQSGLTLLGRLSPQPTDVYLITDGLPTQGASTGLLSGCRASASKVTGECRKKIFRASINRYRFNQKINVILLPLEGDPEAAPEFWTWTSSTQGLLLIPASGWP